MQNQFALWLAIMFGFTSCTEEGEDNSRDPDLVGTWMEVRTTQVGGDWLSTERSTVIVERDGDQLRFRNCLDNSSVQASVKNKTVTVEGNRYPDLNISEDTLTAVSTFNNTEVVLYRLDTTTSPVLASLSLQQPGELDMWTQLCLETRVSDNDGYRMAFKASNVLMDIMVTMDLQSDTPFDPSATFSYPDAQRTVSGSYTLPGGDIGTLTDPAGTLIISESSTRDFQADIVMTSSHGGTIEISGLLSVEQQWFDTE